MDLVREGNDRAADRREQQVLGESLGHTRRSSDVGQPCGIDVWELADGAKLGGKNTSCHPGRWEPDADAVVAPEFLAVKNPAYFVVIQAPSPGVAPRPPPVCRNHVRHLVGAGSRRKTTSPTPVRGLTSSARRSNHDHPVPVIHKVEDSP